jgi:two-component system response regulator (stage 0 sporulation protein F)
MPNRILIVDDEENIRKLYTEELSAEGYEVSSAESGETALDRVEKVKPDLVVLDIKMADADGLDILGSIKRQHQNLPVVLNSAYSIYKSDFNSWLADAYVVKSSDLDELKTRIREILAI